MAEKMTSKERVKAAFARKPVDRVPMMILLGESWLIEREGMSYDDLWAMNDLGAELIVKTYNEIESDSVMTGIGCWMGWLNAVGCPIVSSKPGASIEVKECIHDIEVDIPALDMSKIREKLESSELVQKMMRQTRDIKKLTGDAKCVAGQLNGPFSAASMMIGTREFMVMLGKKSPHVKTILDYTTECLVQLGNMYCENGCDTLMVCDPVSSGDLISPKMYKDVVLPTIKTLSEKVKNCEIFIVHICGKAGMRVAPLSDLDGVDGFSVDSPVDMKEALAIAEGKMTMLGNLNPNEALMIGTTEDVYKAARVNVELAGLKGGYVLMPGCDLAAKTPVENIRAMVRASADYAAKG